MTKKNVLTLEPWLTMDSMIVQIYQISYILWIAWQDPLPVETCSNVLTFYMNHIFFWVMQMSCFVQKKHDRACKNVSTYYSVPGIRSQNLCITTQALVPLLYQCSPLWFFLTIIANLCYLQWRLIIDRILRKRFFSIFFPIFRKYLSVSPWNLPGYFSVSFRFPQVTEFGKSSALANRRRSTWPILFVSFTQPCDQHDRKIRTIRKSAARWCGRRARGCRKLILRVNLLYVPNIKMYRRLRSGSVHNFGTCAWRTEAQWQIPGKKRVSTQEKSDFAMALRFFKRKSRSCAQT